MPAARKASSTAAGGAAAAAGAKVAKKAAAPKATIAKKAATPKKKASSTASAEQTHLPVDPQIASEIAAVSKKEAALPSREAEKVLWSRKMTVSAVDEAGRGPLCGPVVAACVICPPGMETMIEGVEIKDSKKMNETERDKAYAEMMKVKGFRAAVTIVSAKEIDRINILQATMTAMNHCVHEVHKATPCDFALIDGNRVPPNLPVPAQAIVKGDAKSFAISAASIVAKVTRDEIMMKHDQQWPQYGFANHKGYGTAGHMSAIHKHGSCPIHRMTFAPLNKLPAGKLHKGEVVEDPIVVKLLK